MLQEGGSKKIAVNTMIVYVRLIVVTVVTLFTTRYVLQALGVSDYGLYNVVASLITMLNVVSIAMHTTTRRFINIEMGIPNGNPNKIFNICLVLHICFALFVLLIAETIGLFYISYYLNVSPDRLDDAYFVFQISTIVACLGIMNVPYQGVLEALEKFGQVALIDISNALLKVIAVFFLIHYEGNALRFYAVGICLIMLSSFILYRVICYRQCYFIVQFHWCWEKKLYKEILVFNNYTAIGATSCLGRTQGANMLVNYYFGTFVNAAFAIAYQVQNFVQLLVGNLGVASAPQITQSYGRGDKEQAVKLCGNINRYSILIMILLFFPLYVELEFILTLWLGEVPAGTYLFCQWILFSALLGSFSASISTLIQATGKIKWFQIIYSFSELSMLFLSWFLFYIGFPAVTLIIVFCVFTFIFSFVTLWMMHFLIDFKAITFVKESYWPPLKVITIMGGWLFFYNFLPIHSSIMSVSGILVTGLMVLLLIFYLGITENERRKVMIAVQNRIRNL
ncbi:MATE family efflux transporter [uncultured Bacteroides sp.]|uniref:lipopolysaccharide biosynthesis protein n=1 Tax=uncultured Bacteroides sp. TaxID=162156 RepID=UPI0025F5757B|nr:MATE family efflux transporter [uncultured Bacteroides sp.]